MNNWHPGKPQEGFGSTGATDSVDTGKETGSFGNKANALTHWTMKIIKTLNVHFEKKNTHKSTMWSS